MAHHPGSKGAVLMLALLAGFSKASACEACKDTIAFPYDPFAVRYYDGNAGWIKFTILLSDPGTVIFQDSNTYRFHYEFATTQLEPFLGMTPAEFNAVSLHAQGQQSILGAVVLPPAPIAHYITQYGIQLIRYEPYDPVVVRDVFNLVRSKVLSAPGVQAFYFPSYDQQASAEQQASYLGSQGIVVSSAARWAAGNPCYVHGWALGRLNYVPGDQIEASFLSGALQPGDVLLTDGVPAEIPLPAGIISLSLRRRTLTWRCWPRTSPFHSCI